MVDFSQPINNEDMVAGLNKLVRLNADVLASLEHLPDSLSDAQAAQAVRELEDMHRRHIGRIADAMHILGGEAQGADWRRWVSEGRIAFGKLKKDKGVLEAIQSEEKKLKAEYARKRDQLRASPEAVAVINEVLDDSAEKQRALDAALAHLH